MSTRIDIKDHSPAHVNAVHRRMNRQGLVLEVAAIDFELPPEAMLLRCVIERAIQDAISRPEGSYHHRKYRREARKWLWRRSQEPHGYGWMVALLGWGTAETDAIHRVVFPNGQLGC